MFGLSKKSGIIRNLSGHYVEESAGSFYVYYFEIGTTQYEFKRNARFGEFNINNGDQVVVIVKKKILKDYYSVIEMWNESKSSIHSNSILRIICIFFAFLLVLWLWRYMISIFFPDLGNMFFYLGLLLLIFTVLQLFFANRMLRT